MSDDGRHAADHDDLRGAAQSRDASAPRVLVLGGSADGFMVAETFAAAGWDVLTSFAGRTRERRAPVGRFRVGGFGGAAGLRAYLEAEGIGLLVDATHPFARVITANAAEAGDAAGVPVIHVVRPVWRPTPGDDWRPVATLEAAAAAIPPTDGPSFLTVGRQKIAPFAARLDLSFLIRTVDPPDEPFAHPRSTFLHDRGPFTLDSERRLFRERRVGSLVTANSGGAAAEAKLTAARELGLPVVMVERPAPPSGRITADAAGALALAQGLLAR